MIATRVVAFVALRQLWDRKQLNGIAVLGVALGVLTLIGVRGMMNGFQNKFLGNILQISPHVTIFDRELRPKPPLLSRYTGDFVAASIAHASPSDRQLSIRKPTEIVRTLERTPGIRAASASLAGSAVLGYGSKQYPVDVRGIEPARQDRVTPISTYIVSGSYQGLSISNDAVLLGSGVATRVGAHTGDIVTIGSAAGERRTLKVVGIYESGIPPVDRERVYVIMKTAQILLGKPDVVGRIDVSIEDTELAPDVAAEIERTYGYDAMSWQEQNANFLGIFKQQNTIIGFVIAAILAVGGFGILAIQFMIVLQKTRDIAIFRSVGFRRADVLGIFLIQGAIVAFAGGIVGDVIGHLLLRALSTLKTPIEGMVKSDTFLVYDDPRMYAWGIAFALLVGLLASAVPALRAARVEPVDVLRGQLG